MIESHVKNLPYCRILEEEEKITKRQHVKNDYRES